MKLVNENGLKEIKDFLAENHVLGGDYFTKDMILAWGEKANFQLAEGNPASIEIRSWHSVHGRTQEYTVSDDGVEVVIDAYPDSVEDEVTVSVLQDVLTVLQNAATTAHHAYCGDAHVYCVPCEARCVLARVKKFIDKSEVQS